MDSPIWPGILLLSVCIKGLTGSEFLTVPGTSAQCGPQAADLVYRNCHQPVDLCVPRPIFSSLASMVPHLTWAAQRNLRGSLCLTLGLLSEPAATLQEPCSRFAIWHLYSSLYGNASSLPAMQDGFFRVYLSLCSHLVTYMVYSSSTCIHWVMCEQRVHSGS